MRRVVLLVALAGCGKSEPTPTEPGGAEKERRAKEQQDKLVELRVTADAYRNDLRNRQLKLYETDPGNYPLPRARAWEPHGRYSDDAEYQAAYGKLRKAVADHNRILDHNPTWAVPRLTDSLATER